MIKKQNIYIIKHWKIWGKPFLSVFSIMDKDGIIMAIKVGNLNVKSY